LIFWTAGKLWRTNICHHAKFHHNPPNGFADIVIFFILNMAAIRHVGFGNSQTFGHPSGLEG